MSEKATPKIESESPGSESDNNNNKCLNDVWMYDLHLKKWVEIKPEVRVQAVFNNKKMRKIFEPRMAHSANVVHGNYIVFFGGYCTQSSSYLNNNIAALSLLGCTDYIFS